MASRVQTCPKCRALLEPGTKTCPYCEADQRSVVAPTPEAEASATTRIGTWLILVNVAVFFLTVQLDPERGDAGGGFRPSQVSLVGFGANEPRMVADCGQYWRLLAANFLHVDLTHLLMNSVAMFILIPIAAVTLGLHRMLAIYFTAGVFGFLVSHLFGVRSVGASAAVSGLITALAVYGKRRGAPQLTQQMVMWVGIVLVFGFVSSGIGGPSIDNWGHIGGFVAGAALGWPAAAVRARGSANDRLWAGAAYGWIGVCTAVLAVALVPSVLRTLERRDVIVYASDAQRTVELMMRASRGDVAAAQKLPETFPDGPADSDALAKAMRSALEAVKTNPGQSSGEISAAAVSLIVWKRSLLCSHNLRWVAAR